MKITFFLLVLFFLTPVFARTYVIDCGIGFSFKIDSDDKVSTKSDLSDYQWTHTGRYSLITDNGDEIVIGRKDYWKNTSGTEKYNRLRIALRKKSGTVYTFYYYNAGDTSENLEVSDRCKYYKD